MNILSANVWIPSRKFSSDLFLTCCCGISSVAFENIKTGHQLEDVNSPKTSFPDASVLFRGIVSSFWRGSLRLIFVSESPWFERRFPMPLALQGSTGIILGSLLYHPFDTVRTRQAATTFAHKFEEVDRNVSFSELLERYGIRNLYCGLFAGITQQLLEHILSRVFQMHVEVLISKFLQDKSSLSLLSKFLALILTKILLNPLEITKKNIQNNNGVENPITTAITIWKENGFGYFWREVLWSIPEVCCSLLTTHFVRHLIQSPYDT